MSAPLEELSERYERHHAADRAGGEFVFVPERIPFIRRALGAPGKRILDLGCRSGAVTRHFTDGNHVVGVDVDRVALDAASLLGIETVLADIEQPLPFADADFDAVVAGELLEHVRFPDNVVAEVARVLRPGGVFTGSVPNAYRLRARLFFLAGRPPDNDRTHLHMFSPHALRGVLAGFEDVEVNFCGGRFLRLWPRLLAVDIAFRAVRPPVGQDV